MMQLEPACLPILYLLYVFNKDELSSLVVLGANCPKNIRIEFSSAAKTKKNTKNQQQSQKTRPEGASKVLALLKFNIYPIAIHQNPNVCLWEETIMAF